MNDTNSYFLQCSDGLTENPKLVRGRLENGLEYTILPNENHCDRFEAYLEVLSGSADELDNQRGVAHFCEHVTYMGSRKRDSLIGKDVRTNAFTDFHHTVFYTSCPSKMDDCLDKETSLEKALETLADVVEAPTQFTPSRVDKERQAILSEASIINTLEYRKNCATVKALHSENRLSKRFPIGDIERLKEYSVEDLVNYHSVHYRPSNLHLFVVGDVDTAYAPGAIERVFSRLRDNKEVVDNHLSINADIYRDTVKEKRRGLPPAKHDWDTLGPTVHIWENDQIKNLSLEIVRKMPIPEIKTWNDMYNNIVMKLAYRILSLNFDILQRGAGTFESVEANDYDCTNEGCRIRSFELQCVPYKWEEALSTAVTQTKFLTTQGATKDMFKIVKDSLLLDSSRLDTSKADNKDVIGAVMEATTCGRTVMLPNDEKELIKDILEKVHVDDVNEVSQKLFPWATGESFMGIHLICSTPPPDRSIGYDGVGEAMIADVFQRTCNEPLSEAAIHPKVNTPSKLLSDDEKEEVINRKPYSEEPGFVKQPMLPKESYYDIHEAKEEVLRSLAVSGDLRPVAEKYIDDIRDSFKFRSDIEYITENKPPPPELSKLGEKILERTKHMKEEVDRGKYNNALVQMSKPMGCAFDPSQALYQESAGKNGIHLLTLNNSTRVNVRLDEIDQMSIRAIVPIEYDYNDKEALMSKKRNLLLAAAAMMEGGAMGSLSRLQVEMFCSQHLMDVLISANEDFFSIEMSFPYTKRKKNGNLESAMQILNALIQNHKIEPDAFSRGLEKIKRDRNVYMQDLQAYGTGDLIATLSEGKLTYHDLDHSIWDTVKLDDVQRTLDSIFKRGAVEISIAGDADLQEVKGLLVNYIGTIQLPEAKTPAADRYALAKDIFFPTGEKVDKHSEPISPEEQHKLILVPDNQERAMVLVGGYAPNASGILPDGTHVADLLHRRLVRLMACEDDTNNNVEKLARTCKELWMHPAFPKAACSLMQEILTNRSFTVLRAEKHLTYESTVDFVLYDVQFAGYYIISVHSSFDKSESILQETKKLIEELRSGERPVTQYQLSRAKDQVLARLTKERTTNRQWTSELLGMQSRRMPLKNSLYSTEFEKVLKRITLDDIRLLIACEAFGLVERNIWSRIVHTTLD